MINNIDVLGYEKGYQQGVEDTLKKVIDILDKHYDVMDDEVDTISTYLYEVKKEISTEKGK